MIFRKKTYKSLIGLATLVGCLATATPQRASALQLKVAMDSAQILMGHQTAVRFDIVEPTDRPAQLLVDQNAMPKEVEAVDWVYGDTTDLGGGLREMKRALIIQAFDSGAYTLPPFLLVSGPDTVRSKELTLKVVPVDVSHLEDIHPIAPAQKFETRWFDFLPDWLTDFWGWYLAALLIIAGAVCAYLIFTKKVNVNILPQRRRLPPYQIAMNRLNALRDENLWEKGQEKEYYTRLTDILRSYLAERFGINAMEMTSSQILHTLQENADTRMSREHMQKILEVADFVKFAKVRPLPDDNVRAFQNAVDFVEETKPVEQPQSEPTAAAEPAAQPAVAPQPKKGKEATK